MKEERILGNNIKVLLKDNGVEVSQFANQLGYSTDDVERLCEGRLFSDNQDIRDIAAFFHISVDDLMQRKTDSEYEIAECIHYNHTFKEEQNLDTIMDIFDIICDIKEVL